MAGPSRSDQVTGAHHNAELTRAQSAAAASGTSSWHIPETHSTRPVAHESGGVQGGVTSQWVAVLKSLMYFGSTSARMATLGQPPPQQPTGPTYTAKQSATLAHFWL